MRLPWEEENRIKLDMLAALARSQRALATMIEHAAGAAEAADGLPQLLRRHIAAISACQHAVAENVAGLRIRRVVRGKPGPVWLSGAVAGHRRQGGN